ncbi:hypothetical protein A3860_18625 [Niastella vici]|uniref:Lipoprotein n=1 Tax=Niastella vici TaxID=1703345 RepID=A0A1V9G2J0_9BACT|nr:hypothetical protein [Niastella vici]OQP64774.1 hypothetical protein A3860_18625 [Niastella vici]
MRSQSFQFKLFMLFISILIVSSCSSNESKSSQGNEEATSDRELSMSTTNELNAVKVDKIALVGIQATNPENHTTPPVVDSGEYLMVNEFGPLSVDHAEIYAEDLSSLVGHVAQISPGTTPNSFKYNVYSRSTVDSVLRFSAKAITPIYSNSLEKKATKQEIVDAKLVFLDANINADEFYTYTNQAVMALRLKDDDVNQNKLTPYNCSTSPECKNYVVDWAEIRQIKTYKYKKADKSIKVRNLPPFVSAIFSGGDFAIMKENSDKQVITKILVHLAPIKFWIH